MDTPVGYEQGFELRFSKGILLLHVVKWRICYSFHRKEYASLVHFSLFSCPWLSSIYPYLLCSLTLWMNVPCSESLVNGLGFVSQTLDYSLWTSDWAIQKTGRGMGLRRELESNSLRNLITTEGCWPLTKESCAKHHALELGTMAHACTPNAQEVEKENIKSEASLGYIERPYLKA